MSVNELLVAITFGFAVGNLLAACGIALGELVYRVRQRRAQLVRTDG